MSNQVSQRVVLLVGPGESTRVVVEAIRREHPNLLVIAEPGRSAYEIARMRFRRYGWRTAVGQLLFMLAIRPLLALEGRARRKELLTGYPDAGLPSWIAVETMNGGTVRRLLAAVDPDVVVLHGTRILSSDTLAAISCPIVNMHAGITPAYRGVHGGYWAQVDGRSDLVGTTIHLVDEGIDTGRVLARRYFTPDPKDNFATLPLRHTFEGVPALLAVITALLEGEERYDDTVQHIPSQLRTHPTALEYLRHRARRGIR